MKNLLCTTLFLLYLTITSLFSQELTWVIPPAIDGYDKVEIRNQVLDFIVVKKDGKYGVLSPKGDLIIPIEYDKYDQVTDHHISMYHPKNSAGKVNTFFDKDGYQLDFDRDVNPWYNKPKEKAKKERAAAFEAFVMNTWPGAQFVEGKYSSNKHIIVAEGDTLVKNTYPSQGNVVSDKYLVYRNTDASNYRMIDKDRNVLLEAKKLEIREDDNNNINVGFRGVVDQNGTLQLSDCEEVGTFYKGNYYKVKKAKEQYLAFDPEFNQIFDKPHKYIANYKMDDVTFLVGQSETETYFYRSDTKKTTKAPYKLKQLRNAPKSYYSFAEGDMMGIYDMAVGEVVVEPTHKYVSHIGEEYFVLANDKPVRKKKGSRVFERTLVDTDGETHYNDVCFGISSAGGGYYHIFPTDSTKVLMDADMQEALVYTKKDKLTFSYGWVSFYENDTRKNVRIEQYLAGDKSQWYTDRPKKIDAKDNYPIMYSVQREGKIGFLDENYNLIHPLELESIGDTKGYGPKNMGYFTAKKDGKWGVLQRPTRR